MKTARRAWLAGAFLVSFLFFACISQTGVHAGQSPEAMAASSAGLGVVKVQGTRIAEIDSTHLRLAIDMTTTPAQTATLEDLRLNSLHLNGLPAFAEPIAQRIDLVKGRDAALPPMYITVQFRDVTTVTPLREMIEKQSVQVEAQISASIKMNFFERLALRTEHPRVALTLNEEVPVTFGSSPLQRQAALGILSVVEFGLHGSALARKEIPGLESQWIRDLHAQGPNKLMRVETTYSLREHKSTYPVSFDQLGFRITSGQVIVTAELIAPWEFDPEFLSRLKTGEVKMVKKSTDVQLHSIGKQGKPLLLSQGDFKLEQLGRAEQEGLLVQHGDQDDYKRINAHRRGTPDALGVIYLRNPTSGDGFPIAPMATAQLQAWDKVALYRIVQDSSSGARSIDVIQLSARRKGQAIHLDHPVDPSFFGSPILVPEGVIGIVQDEDAGAFLPVALGSAPGSGGTAAR